MGPTLVTESRPVARWTRTPKGWRVRVWGTDADLSGQKIDVVRKNKGASPVRLGQLVAADPVHGSYYTVGGES